MHIYLLVTGDEKNAYVYSNLTKVKEHYNRIGNYSYTYEWMELWCSPMEVESGDMLHNDIKPWEYLKLAYFQNHWDTRAKYPEKLIEDKISR